MDDSTPPLTRRSLLFVAVTVIGWGVLWWGVKNWGEHLLLSHEMKLPAPPLAGRWVRQVNDSLIAMVAAAIGLAWVMPIIAERARWSFAVIVAGISTVGFSSLLVTNYGWQAFINPIVDKSGYLNAIDKVHSPHQFLRDFVRLVREVRVGVHVQGHPPGMVLFAWAMNQMGVESPRTYTGLVVSGAGVTVIGVLIVVRRLVDETTARRALPFVALSPACVWVVTSDDAFFAACAAWTMVCMAYAITTTHRRSVFLSIACGIMFFVCIMLSYGLALFGLPLFVLCASRKRFQPFVIAMTTTLVGLLLIRTQGFWWLDGLRTTKQIYYEGVARNRPYSYFIVANIAALAIALGPMMPAAISRLRDRRAWVVVGGVFGAIVFADLSGMSKAEVERIWLPFTFFLLVGGASLWAGSRPRRTAQIALLVQLAFTVWLQNDIKLYW